MQDLERRIDAAVDRRHELLREDRLQEHGQLNADLRLLVGREHVDDAVDRVGRADGMERGDDEVARFGGGHGDLDRFVVAHFADEDHIGRLAQGGAERGDVVFGVVGDLALADDALFVAVQIFDRVFERDDVAAAVGVDAVDDAADGLTGEEG